MFICLFTYDSFYFVCLFVSTTWVNLNIIIDGFDLIKNKNKNKNGTLYTLLTAPSENRDFGPPPPPHLDFGAIAYWSRAFV